MATTYTMKFQLMDDPSAPILEIPAPDKNWKKVENYDLGFEISSSKKVYCIDYASLSINCIRLKPSCTEVFELKHEEAKCWLADMHIILNESLYRVISVDKWEQSVDNRESIKDALRGLGFSEGSLSEYDFKSPDHRASVEQILAYMWDDMKAMTFPTGKPCAEFTMKDLVELWKKYPKKEKKHCWYSSLPIEADPKLYSYTPKDVCSTLYPIFDPIFDTVTRIHSEETIEFVSKAIQETLDSYKYVVGDEYQVIKDYPNLDLPLGMRVKITEIDGTSVTFSSGDIDTTWHKDIQEYFAKVSNLTAQQIADHLNYNGKGNIKYAVNDCGMILIV